MIANKSTLFEIKTRKKSSMKQNRKSFLSFVNSEKSFMIINLFIKNRILESLR